MNFCCEDMQAHVRIVTEHTAQLCDGKAISYLPQFHEYGIPCGDGHSHIVIHYCPWCAKPLLPASLRERWVDELIAMGYADPLFDRRSPRHTRLTAGGENELEIRTTEGDRNEAAL